MAEKLQYRPPAPDPEERRRREAYAELDDLVLTLHEHNVLRLLRDMAGSASDLTLILARELSTEQGYRALSNLYLLTRVLGRIPPAELGSVAEAMAEGLTRMGRAPPADRPYPPGLGGTYRMLKDDELWQALGPVLEGVKAFTGELRRQRAEQREDGAGGG